MQFPPEPPEDAPPVDAGAAALLAEPAASVLPELATAAAVVVAAALRATAVDAPAGAEAAGAADCGAREADAWPEWILPSRLC